jgi:glutamate-1-semialdehyde 2,1-aminomutase
MSHTAKSKLASDDVLELYLARTKASRAIHERLEGALPGGETRTVTFYPPYPIAIADAEGAFLTDVDGNRYIDFANNMTSLLHGHRYEPIVRAVQTAIGECGTAQAGPHRFQVEYVELLQDRFPGLELLRLTNSGSEAAILALRIARRTTGRSRFIMFDGAYHGLGAEFLDENPARVVLPYNDLDILRRTLDNSVAAVVCESFLGSGGVIPSNPGFVAEVQQLCAERGALFVLDEVQSHRTHFAGVHGALQLHPDLILMGKGVGGGFPVGILGGKREHMSLLSAKQPGALIHSGTFNGNVVTCAAGFAALSNLTEETIAEMDRLASLFATEIESRAKEIGLSVRVTRAGSILCVHFRDTVPVDGADARPQSALARWWHLVALLEGVYVVRGGRMNLSSRMTEGDILSTADALGRCFGTLYDLQMSGTEDSEILAEGVPGEWFAGR